MAAVQAADSEGDHEAYARGLNRGWDHANFCEAYAPDETHLVPTDVDGPHQLSYQAGWREGVRRFLANQWQNGTPRDAD